MKNLISMTDFVLCEKVRSTLTYHQAYVLIRNYANFLKQPLELWMFVPCVDNEIFNYSMHGNKEQFEQAKERCLFEGFSEKDAKFVLYVNENIEDLIEFNLQLTQTAIKKLGL